MEVLGMALTGRLSLPILTRSAGKTSPPSASITHLRPAEPSLPKAAPATCCRPAGPTSGPGNADTQQSWPSIEASLALFQFGKRAKKEEGALIGSPRCWFVRGSATSCGLMMIDFRIRLLPTCSVSILAKWMVSRWRSK